MPVSNAYLYELDIGECFVVLQYDNGEPMPSSDIHMVLESADERTTAVDAHGILVELDGMCYVHVVSQSAFLQADLNPKQRVILRTEAVKLGWERPKPVKDTSLSDAFSSFGVSLKEMEETMRAVAIRARSIAEMSPTGRKFRSELDDRSRHGGRSGRRP